MNDGGAFHRYYLPDQADRVPKATGGTYAFRVLFPSDLELGFQTVKNLDTIKSNILSYAVRLGSAFAPPILSGDLQSDAHGYHLKTIYSATLSNSNFKKDLDHELSTVLGSISQMSDLEEVTTSVRSAFAFLNPVYIGMCSRRSFHSRLHDHLSARTGLYQRMVERKLRWTDLALECYPISYSEHNINRQIERTIQLIANPICSRM